MDRWTGADDDTARRREPKGRVAELGLGGFVKAAVPTKPSASERPGSIEIVPSRREERAATAAAVASSIKQNQNHGSAVPPFSAPAWACEPPPGAGLRVLKEGTLVQTIPLNKKATVFGRHADTDMVLEHASVSRFHAAICFRKETGADAASGRTGEGVDLACMVMDLGSAHGTFVNGKPLAKRCPTVLRPGAELRFGASTRSYALQPLPQQASDAAAPPAGKKRRIQFGDDAGGSCGSKPLETVVGFSDGGHFTAVGPKAAECGERGRFSTAVQSSLRTGGGAAAAAERAGSGSVTAGQEPIKRYMDDAIRLQSSAGLFASLPAPMNKAGSGAAPPPD